MKQAHHPLASRGFRTRLIPVLASLALLLVAACGGAPSGPPAALKGMPPGDYAWFDTTAGDLIFRLTPDKTPLTVANFIGLANGERAFYDPATKTITKGHFYDGLTFFRFESDTLIQGGDRTNTGTGYAGFSIPDEISPDLKYDAKGKLGMANHGPDTNGTQFFITFTPLPSLDGRYTLFGSLVSGQDVLDKIAKAPINRFQKEALLNPIDMNYVRVYQVKSDGTAVLAPMPDVKGLPEAKMPEIPGAEALEEK